MRYIAMIIKKRPPDHRWALTEKQQHEDIDVYQNFNKHDAIIIQNECNKCV